MNLLLLIHDINAIGGMEVQLSYLAGGLAEAGHDVRLVSLRSGPSADGSELSWLDPRVEVIHLGAHARAARAAAVRRLARLARNSDLVHCTGWDTSLWGRLAALLAHRRVVVADHAGSRVHQVSSSGAPRARWIALHNRLLDPFTGATVICADRQREVLRQEGVDPAKIVLIPNGVPVGRLRSQAAAGLTRADLGIPSEAKVIAHVASFRPMKRQRLALDTTVRLRQELGDVRVIFAGSGPELEAIRSLAAERGADWAVFLGAQRNVASVFAMADVAILPSSAEALPMALLESIAVGVPVVASDVGDVAEVIERTGAGVCVPPEDHDAFFAAVHQIVADGGVRQRLAAAAEAAQDELDAATMVRRYERVFHAVLNRGPRSAALSNVA